jgi:hypothetical protein
MNWLESTKSVEWDAKFLKGFHLILISEIQPEKSRQIKKLRWVVKK